MTKLPGLHVPLETPERHPIIIGIEENPFMRRFDVTLTVGNFKTREDAKAASQQLIKIVERDFGSKRSAGIA